MNGFSLLLAARYLRSPRPRSALLFLIPLVPLFLFAASYGGDRLLRREVPLLNWGAPAVLAISISYITSVVIACAFVGWYWWYALFAQDPRPRGWAWLNLVPKLLIAILLTAIAGPGSMIVLVVYLLRRRPSSLALRLGLFLSMALVWLLGPLCLVVIAKSPVVLRLHAEAAMLIGRMQWVFALTAVSSFVFILLIRYLTIFATIATYAVFLGCGALVIVLSVMSGFEGDIKRKILGSHAHVVVTRPDEAFTDWAERLPKIAKLPGLRAVTPELSGEAMISSPANRSNVIVHGVDPATFDSVTSIGSKVEIGSIEGLAHPEKIHAPELELLGEDEPTRPDTEERKRRSPPGILVGRELAHSLRIYLGDDVSLVSPTGGIGPSGAVPKARPYRVAGVFFTGMFEYDSKFVYVTLPSAQRLFDQPDEVTSLEIRLPDADATDGVVRDLSAMLGSGYEVQDWKAINRSLFSALALEKIVMFIFLSFIVLVGAFAMVANGHMIATRKTAEIAMLKSMGASDSAIAQAFFWLSSFLGIIGVVLGVSGGVAFALALERWGFPMDSDVFYLTQLPVRLELREVLIVALSGLAVSVLATIHPVWAAARLTPVEGLREGGH